MKETSPRDEKKIIIYTDGASRGNPGSGGWGASISYPNGRIVEIGGAEGHTTNNRMELMAILKSLEHIRDNLGKAEAIEVMTDSAYALNGATRWVYGWYKNNWQTAEGNPVANQDIWEAIYQIIWYFKSKCDLNFTKVSGHSGVLGNERADLIATSFADGERILLYVGGGRDYIKLLGDSVGHRVVEAKKVEIKKERAKGPAYSYLSQVGGLIEIHRDWKDCEARVLGKSGAKFKKAMTPEEEESIILSWTTNRNDGEE